MKKAAFLDRDGVLNKDKGYIWQYEDFIWMPTTKDAIKALKENNFLIVVITNQAGINKKLYTLEDVIKLHEIVNQSIKLTHNVQIDDFFICPHTAEDNCSCRKPKPGLILDAIKKYNIDINQSFLIGDRDIDIQAAQAAGVKGYLINYNESLLELVNKILKEA